MDWGGHDLENQGSLLIDSILSQDEAEEVVSMLNMANELEGGVGLPSFYTSSQMGGNNPAKRLHLPPLSPISPRAAERNSVSIYEFQDAVRPLFSSPSLDNKNMISLGGKTGLDIAETLTGKNDTALFQDGGHDARPADDVTMVASRDRGGDP